MSRGGWLAAAAGLLLVSSAGAAGFALRALSPAAQTAAPVLFGVAHGESLGAIASHLEQQGLVRNAVALEWLGRLRGLSGELHAGEYRLSAAERPAEILERIARGRVETYELVVPEGFTAAQIGERLEAEGLAEAAAFGAVVRDAAFAAELGVEGDGLEGYLFPETYRLPRHLPAQQIARIFVGHFLAAWAGLEPRARERGMSMREVVTLASIVEKETAVPEERPLIASVFHNRLRRGMRLETDPTVIYGIARFDGNLRRRDLENPDNPYNTYRIRGLPPGAIANPGARALWAVVEPAPSPYLYFVSRNDGTHAFSRTFREHVVAVNQYQRRGLLEGK